MVVEKPNILGHESAGIIEAVGSNVKNVQVGDRVAIEVGLHFIGMQILIASRASHAERRPARRA
jgi:Zn-dependent alcohol dehydrogenase